ncbi:MAG: DUF2281 domain-containing protein [Methylococcaceae bacterium]|nr:DUF2281 domain-containing protein [Methylococcaceae bacterium]
MTYSIQEITAKISELPEPVQQEVFNFIEFMQIKVARQSSSAARNETASLSEPILSTDWNQPEEKQSLANTRKAGALAGRIKISDDFNAPLTDFADYER